jgi:hypothetical protein
MASQAMTSLMIIRSIRVAIQGAVVVMINAMEMNRRIIAARGAVSPNTIMH